MELERTKKRGRPPKDDARRDAYRLRLNKEERAMLEWLAAEHGLTLAESLRRAIRQTYNYDHPD